MRVEQVTLNSQRLIHLALEGVGKEHHLSPNTTMTQLLQSLATSSKNSKWNKSPHVDQ
jgi:hypothetical protein